MLGVPLSNRKTMNKKLIVVALVAVVVIGVFYYLANKKTNEVQAPVTPTEETKKPAEETKAPVTEDKEEVKTTPAEGETKTAEVQPEEVIGKSAGGRDIRAYHYGTGAKEILLVGGIHGGYSWNTALLAYQMMDYLDANPKAIPSGVRVTVIPVLNPDGLSRVVDSAGRFKPTDVSTSPEAKTAGRFNSNNVDLNRNFDCNWQATAVWQNKTVSGGTGVFSEPEARAIRDYAQKPEITAVVAWYSSAGGVFSSSCNGEVSAATQTMTDVYAKASGYPAHKDFDYYEISGDMTNWFAKNNVPAIGVVLTSSDDVEWDKNLAGVKAVLANFSK